MLSDDVLKWAYYGKSLAYYEELRQQYVKCIEDITDENEKEQIKRDMVEQFRNVIRWYAFQFLFEEAYRERIVKEITLNMLRHEKFNAKDIEQILPYMSQERIITIQECLARGESDWEVITNG